MFGPTGAATRKRLRLWSICYAVFWDFFKSKGKSNFLCILHYETVDWEIHYLSLTGRIAQSWFADTKRFYFVTLLNILATSICFVFGPRVFLVTCVDEKNPFSWLHSEVRFYKRMSPNKFLPYSGISHDGHHYFCLAPMLNSLTSLLVWLKP